jgi:FKBP-type peptidyl-prolyl cis-trans isomerase SlyD
MPLEDGDVVEFDYELWVEGREGLYDTTLEGPAKAAGIHNENAYYGPVVHAIGSGRIIGGLERELRNAKVGQTKEIEIAPADAYGERDPKLIETVSMQEFKKGDVNPQPGLGVNYKGRQGTVVTVGAGRVRVDFNSPLAGKKLKYRFTLRKVAKDDKEKLESILKMDFPAPVTWKVETGQVEGKSTGTVTVPEVILYQRHWVNARLRVLVDAGRYTKLDQVRFVESYPVQPKRAAEVATATPSAQS